MSITTSCPDQDAMRVANRYAGMIQKAETLQDRARACQDAAQQYRRDARANQESAENHRQAARTIRKPDVAYQHAVAARDTEAEAAREILAARYYEQQAEQYQAEAHGITQAGPAGAGAAPEPPAVAEPAQARRVTNPRGRVYEYDPCTGATAVIEPDGWRAVVPPSSASGTTARLLWWNAEIRDGRGNDATEEAARTLLGRLTAAELREVTGGIGTSARGARTKPQLIDAIVKVTISSARKARALRQL